MFNIFTEDTLLFQRRKELEDDFKGQYYFSQGKTNSCDVAIGCYGIKQNFPIK